MSSSNFNACFDVPGKVCTNARLKGSNLKYPTGTTSGQAGWDVGINFISLSDLATQLKNKFKRGEISRLAIQGQPKAASRATGIPSGYLTINDLNIGSIINTVEKGPSDTVWR